MRAPDFGNFGLKYLSLAVSSGATIASTPGFVPPVQHLVADRDVKLFVFSEAPDLGGLGTGALIGKHHVVCIECSSVMDRHALAQREPPAFSCANRLPRCGQRAFNRHVCLLYTSPSPRDLSTSRMPSSA